MTKTANLELRRTAKANGVSLWQIADKLGCGTKSVDNALQRIKRKVQKQMNEQGE